jgi:hypothetical protein
MTILSYAQRERERIKRIRKQMAEAQAKRFVDPDAMPSPLKKVLVVYVWRGHRWILAGFLRRRYRRKVRTMNRVFSSIRRKLRLDKDTHIKLMDLGNAILLSKRSRAWITQPPRHVPSIKMPEPSIKKVNERERKPHYTRYRKSVATTFHKRVTTFIALGHNPWDRDPRYVYLGPLSAEQLGDADAEARTAFPIYKHIIIVPIESLSQRLRNQMNSAKRVSPGTRILWPEPIALETVVAMPELLLPSVSARDAVLHVDDTVKLVNHVVRNGNDKTVIQSLAVLSFLCDLPTYPHH